MTNNDAVHTTIDQLPIRLLGVWAHPDDEAYLSAGLMARMTDAGAAVTVLTATRGERGTEDPALYGSAGFASHREQELRASLAELGVTDLRILGYADGACDQADDAQAVAAIERVVREVRPDMVITFGPDGITGHPDHHAVSRWTTEAWRRVRRGRLRYATMTDEFVVRHAALHAEMGVFDDFGLAGPSFVERDQLVAEYVLSDTELDRKRRALAGHASQTAGLAELMGEATYRSWWNAEAFRAPSPAELLSCPLSQSRHESEAVAA